MMPHETQYSVLNRAYQRQFASILYVKYADVILMMGINCEGLTDILCLDCGFLNVRVNLFFTLYRITFYVDV